MEGNENNDSVKPIFPYIKKMQIDEQKTLSWNDLGELPFLQYSSFHLPSHLDF